MASEVACTSIVPTSPSLRQTSRVSLPLPRRDTRLDRYVETLSLIHIEMCIRDRFMGAVPKLQLRKALDEVA